MNFYINCNLTNTLVTVTSIDNKVVYQISSKSLQSKTKKKNNPHTLRSISYILNKLILKNQPKKNKTNKQPKIQAPINLFFRGFGKGRYHILKRFNRKKIKIKLIEDRTFLPFNGCRASKKKRR